jgi:xanthine dehydrogenase accessory factor
MEFHELLDRWSKRGGNAVLATIITVEGHAYRKEGAAMLIFEDGERGGGISPGCLEADLTERVAGLLEAGAAQVIEYDMRDVDDFAWGEAVGCGGSIRVLMEPIAGTLTAALLELLKVLNRGEAGRFIRHWGADGCVSYMIEAMQPKQASEKSGRDSYSAVTMVGVKQAAADASKLTAAAIDGDKRDSFVIYCEPRPRLIIFGAGADAEPIAAMAGKVGFHVVVADWREALCCSGHFAGCDTFVGSPAETVERLGVNEADYMVIMSHQLQRDRQCLDALWNLSPRYVGLLGSKSRAGQLLEGRIPPSWLKTPVGLAIGAEGPMEIAVSVVAELIAVRRNTDAASERGYSHASKSNRDLFGGRWKPAYGDSEAYHSTGQQGNAGWPGV